MQSGSTTTYDYFLHTLWVKREAVNLPCFAAGDVQGSWLRASRSRSGTPTETRRRCWQPPTVLLQSPKPSSCYTNAGSGSGKITVRENASSATGSFQNLREDPILHLEKFENVSVRVDTAGQQLAPERDRKRQVRRKRCHRVNLYVHLFSINRPSQAEYLRFSSTKSEICHHRGSGIDLTLRSRNKRERARWVQRTKSSQIRSRGCEYGEKQTHPAHARPLAFTSSSSSSISSSSSSSSSISSSSSSSSVHWNWGNKPERKKMERLHGTLRVVTEGLKKWIFLWIRFKGVQVRLRLRFFFFQLYSFFCAFVLAHRIHTWRQEQNPRQKPQSQSCQTPIPHFLKPVWRYISNGSVALAVEIEWACGEHALWSAPFNWEQYWKLLNNESTCTKRQVIK